MHQTAKFDYHSVKSKLLPNGKENCLVFFSSREEVEWEKCISFIKYCLQLCRAGLKAITTLSHIQNEKSTHCCHSCHILGVNFTKCESLIRSEALAQRQRNDNIFKPYYETHQLSIYWGLCFNRKLGQSAAPMINVINPSFWGKLKVIGSLFRTILNITTLSSRYLREYCVQHVLQLAEQTGFCLDRKCCDYDYDVAAMPLKGIRENKLASFH